MSWYNRLANDKKALVSTGLYQSSASLEPKPHTDSVLSAWDLNKLDYNASGADGWVNRTIGFTSLVNPLAWGGTYEGLVNRQQAEKEEGNVFSQSVNNLLGTAGSVLNGTFQGTNMAEQAVKSTLLTAGSFADEISENIRGEHNGQSLWQDLSSSWDLSQTKDIGTAEAAVWAQGKGSNLVNDMSNNVFYGNDTARLKQVRKDFDNAVDNWGIGWQNSNFNIFDDKDQKVFEWGNKDSSWASYVIQPLNFAATIVLDPINLVPFGGIAKSIGVARRGLTTAEKVGDDIAEVTKAAEGNASKYDQTYKYFADSSADQIINHRVFRDMSGDKKYQVAEMMGKAKSIEDVAKIDLAVNYGSRRAAVELAAKYGDEGHFKLMLDDAIGGGYGVRLATNPANRDILDQGVITDQRFLESIDKYLDEVNDTPFVRQLKNTMFKEGVDEQGIAKLVADPINLRTTRYAGGLEGAAEIAGANYRNALMRGAGSETHWVTKLGNGLPSVVTVLRRGSLTSSRGVINFEDADGTSFDKAVGFIDDIDKMAKGKLTENGTRAALYSAYRSAGSAAERAQVISQIETLGWDTVARKHGIDPEQASLLSENIRKKMNNYEDSMREKGRIVHPDGKTIIEDPLFRGTTPNTRYLTDFNKIDKFFASQGETRINNAIASETGKDFGAATLNSFAYDLKTGAADTITAANRLWQFGILTRPARLGREWLQNFSAAVLSGHLTSFLRNQSFGRSVANTLSIPARAADNILVHTGRRESLEASERRAYQLEQDAAQLEIHAKSTAEKAILDALDNPGALSATDRVQLEGLNISSTVEELHHTFVKGLPKDIDFGRGMAMSNTKAEAASYLDNIQPLKSYNLDAKLSSEDLRVFNDLTTSQIERNKLIKQKADLQTQKGLVKLNETIEKQIDSIDTRISRLQERAAATDNSIIKDKLELDIADLQADKTQLAAKYHSVPTADIIDSRIFLADSQIKNIDGAIAKADKVGISGRSLSDISKEFEATKTDLLKELNNGNIVQLKVKGGQGWATRDANYISSLGANLGRHEIRVLPKGEYPYTQTMEVYGNKLNIAEEGMPKELQKALGLHNKTAINDYINSNKWTNDPKLIKWAEENGIGKIVLNDAASPSGQSILAVPKFIKNGKNNPVDTIAKERVAANVDRAYREADVKLTRSQKEGKKTLDELMGMPPQNIEEVGSYIKSAAVTAKSLREEASGLRNTIDRRARATALKPEENLTIGNNTYEGAFAGQNGSVYSSLSDAELPTKMLGNSPDLATGGKTVYSTIDPSNPRYFEGWAGWLNYVGRTDPAISMLAKGATRDDMIKYYRTDPVGKQTARDLGVGKKFTTAEGALKQNNGKVEGLSIEDYVDLSSEIVARHLDDPVVRQMFNDGHTFTEDSLRRAMTGKEDSLIPLDGRVVYPEIRQGITGSLSRFMDQTSKVLAGAPQTTMFNHPMFRGIYNERVKLLNKMSAPNGETLSAATRSAIQDQARKDSLKEMQKWLYNVKSRTNLEQGLSQIVPFLTAYTFTVRSFANVLKDNPAMALWVSSMGNQTVGKLPWTDENGEPTDIVHANALVLPVSQEVRDVLGKLPWQGSVWKDAQEIKLSARSMNIWFGGEAIPGMGPLVTIPVSNIAKNNPELANMVNENSKFFPGGEGVLDYLLPFGTSTVPGSVDQLLPGWTKPLVLDKLMKSPKFIQTLSEITVYEDAQYRNGLRKTAPTKEELEQKTRAVYEFKANVAANSPFSFTVNNSYDLARQKYFDYTKKYGEEGAFRFISENPELYYAVVNSNKNEYNLSSNPNTVSNLQKYSGVVDMVASSNDAGKDLMPFLMNVSSDDMKTYDQNSANWLKTHSAVDGTDTYLGVLSPDEMRRKVGAQEGWIKFNKAMGVLDAEASRRGVAIENDNELAYYKKAITDKLKTENPTWAQDYGDFDPTKYQTRADLLSEAINDPTWATDNGNRTDVKSIQKFLMIRNSVQNELARRKQSGASGTLAGNDRLAAAYADQIQQLKNQSLGFSDFYNKYFDGDSLR